MLQIQPNNRRLVFKVMSTTVYRVLKYGYFLFLCNSNLNSEYLVLHWMSTAIYSAVNYGFIVVCHSNLNSKKLFFIVDVYHNV